MTQYSKRMVIIHWLTFTLVIVAWYLGDGLVEARQEKSATLSGHYAHAMVGGTVLMLTILRWILRGVDGSPPPVVQSIKDMVGKGIQHFLYILLIVLSASGMMIVLTSGVGLALLTGDVSLLPAKYTGPGIIPRAAHEILMNVLIVAVLVHQKCLAIFLRRLYSHLINNRK